MAARAEGGGGGAHPRGFLVVRVGDGGGGSGGGGGGGGGGGSGGAGGPSCAVCGCSAEVDEFRDRVCSCDTCSKSGCHAAASYGEAVNAAARAAKAAAAIAAGGDGGDSPAYAPRSPPARVV